MARWTPDCVEVYDDSRDFEHDDDLPSRGSGEDEEVICNHCNGSGEGMYDGSRCGHCGGSGVEWVAVDENDLVDEGEVDEDDIVDESVIPTPSEGAKVQANRVTTSTGIHIGGAYVPPPAPMSNDAQYIQDVLRGYDPSRKAHRETVIVAIAAVASVIAWWLL